MSAETGKISDGSHTFDELYEYRCLYHAFAANRWAQTGDYEVHRSRCHHDGEPCGDGEWFIVVAETPEGQVNNHYPLKHWDRFYRVPERDRAAEWDGHTPAQAAERLAKILAAEAAAYTARTCAAEQRS
ncbi:hypothetical protein [Nocardia terpenica]|uniref:WDGH domain-containing protein n=1 Tax=Nocardia terpenica TaxID=455432 RepID=A0A164H2U6_9NOCA|nr:hypothetical protein [Nocardia terpenica]KZM68152.1 hypothetical protein AWN90_09430 [Nocardia terpenica]NQE88988.1 hypothetical protein [Nocardia terpenica]